MLDRVYRDAPDDPTLQQIMEGFDQHFQQIADQLAHRWTKKKRRTDARDALRHLVRFSTWQSLERDAVTNSRKAKLALRWLQALRPHDDHQLSR